MYSIDSRSNQYTVEINEQSLENSNVNKITQNLIPWDETPTSTAGGQGYGRRGKGRRWALEGERGREVPRVGGHGARWPCRLPARPAGSPGRQPDLPGLGAPSSQSVTVCKVRRTGIVKENLC